MLREIIRADTLPDYRLTEEPGDLIRVTPRDAVLDEAAGQGAPTLSPGTLDEARALMPGYDVYALEAEWKGVWQRSGRPVLRSPDKTFLGWVRKRRD